MTNTPDTPTTPDDWRTPMTHAFPPPPDQPTGVPPWPPLPPAPAASRPKPKRWPWIAGIVVALLLGLTIGGSGGSKPSSSPASVPTTQTVTVVAPAPQQPEQDAAEPPSAQGASGALTSFGSGTYEVGTGDGQIAPGKYKTQGGGPIGSCYWARLKNTDGDFESIITNGNAEGPTTVTISKNDGAFETRCTWTRAG